MEDALRLSERIRCLVQPLLESQTLNRLHHAPAGVAQIALRLAWWPARTTAFRHRAWSGWFRRILLPESVGGTSVGLLPTSMTWRAKHAKIPPKNSRKVKRKSHAERGGFTLGSAAASGTKGSRRCGMPPSRRGPSIQALTPNDSWCVPRHGQLTIPIHTASIQMIPLS